MKRVNFLAYPTICSLLIIAHSIAAYANADANDISIQALDPTPSSESQANPIAQHLLGGQTVELPLIIRGHCEKPLDMRARLVQLAVSLGAPAYEEDLEVCSGQTLSDGETLEINFLLPLPEVRSKTEFELIYQAKVQEEEWFDAGRTRIHLYPNDILNPLKPLSEKTILRLKDDEDALRPLLDTLEVSHIDYRSPVFNPEMPIITFIINSNNPRDSLDLRDMGLRIRNNETAIIFNEHVRTLPKVVKLPWQNGHLIQVDLEILKNLHNDPRSQNVFMEIIKLTHPVN